MYLFISNWPFAVKALQNLKTSLGLPRRFGWNGDPCVPQQHPWSGVDCHFDRKIVKWVIDGLYFLNLNYIFLCSFMLRIKPIILSPN